MKVVVIDAQGGGIGKQIVEQMKIALPSQKLIAIGTNSLATAAMIRAGADQGATGENAIRVTANDADLILCPIGMILCDAMLGEVTSVMACAISSSKAHKIIVPVARCQVTIAGYNPLPVSDAVKQAVAAASELITASNLSS